MAKYSDRPWYVFHLNRTQWYQKQAEEYEHYYHAQKSLADHRLQLLEQLGIVYNVDRDMYIRSSDGTALWT